MNNVTDRMWISGVHILQQAPCNLWKTILVKKAIYNPNFICTTYYFYIQSTPNGMQKFLVKQPITSNKPIKFNYIMGLPPIVEIDESEYFQTLQ